MSQKIPILTYLLNVHPSTTIESALKRLLVTFSGILKHLQSLKVSYLHTKVTPWQSPENKAVGYRQRCAATRKGRTEQSHLLQSCQHWSEFGLGSFQFGSPLISGDFVLFKGGSCGVFKRDGFKSWTSMRHPRTSSLAHMVGLVG